MFSFSDGKFEKHGADALKVYRQDEDYVAQDGNFYVSGEAGTGKSVVLAHGRGKIPSGALG